MSISTTSKIGATGPVGVRLTGTTGTLGMVTVPGVTGPSSVTITTTATTITTVTYTSFNIVVDTIDLFKYIKVTVYLYDIDGFVVSTMPMMLTPGSGYPITSSTVSWDTQIINYVMAQLPV